MKLDVVHVGARLVDHVESAESVGTKKVVPSIQGDC